MYLMEGPTQYARSQVRPVVRPMRYVRPNHRLGLGFTLQTAEKGVAAGTAAGSAVASAVASGTAVGAGAGMAVTAMQAIPIVGAIAGAVFGIVELFMSIFKGPSPYDEIDSGHVEQGENAVYQIWFLVSGEALYGVVDPNDPATSAVVRDYTKEKPPLPFKQYATWGRTTSAYPNVAKGPLGDTSIDIDQAIQGTTDIINQVWSGLGGQPGVPYSNGDPAKHLAQSEANPFFANGGSGVIPLLQKVKAAREAAVSVRASSPTSSLIPSITAASLLPIAAGGLLVFALLSGE